MKKTIIDAISFGKTVTIHFQNSEIMYENLCDTQPADDNFIGFTYAQGNRYINLSEVRFISIN
ncbi:hypothetical protein AAV12_04015 [Listeria monocytogenes]|nr:hypothetical protein [Listeria monocytogenes]